MSLVYSGHSPTPWCVQTTWLNAHLLGYILQESEEPQGHDGANVMVIFFVNKAAGCKSNSLCLPTVINNDIFMAVDNFGFCQSLLVLRRHTDLYVEGVSYTRWGLHKFCTVGDKLAIPCIESRQRTYCSSISRGNSPKDSSEVRVLRVNPLSL